MFLTTYMQGIPNNVCWFALSLPCCISNLQKRIIHRPLCQNLHCWNGQYGYNILYWKRHEWMWHSRYPSNPWNRHLTLKASAIERLPTMIKLYYIPSISCHHLGEKMSQPTKPQITCGYKVAIETQRLSKLQTPRFNGNMFRFAFVYLFVDSV